MLLIPICRIGTLEALYWMISGGVVPGGMIRSRVWQMEVTCATPASTFAPSWKKTLITATPL